MNKPKRSKQGILQHYYWTAHAANKRWIRKLNAVGRKAMIRYMQIEIPIKFRKMERHLRRRGFEEGDFYSFKAEAVATVLLQSRRKQRSIMLVVSQRYYCILRNELKKVIERETSERTYDDFWHHADERFP